MMQALRELVGEWNASRSERVKLQYAYVIVSVAGIVVAGLVGLLNYDASRAILRVSFAGLGIFVANAVVWALLSGLVLNKFPARRPAARK